MTNQVRRVDGTPWGAILSVFAALAYGVSPIDLIPDLIPLLGWLDDAVAIPLFLIFAISSYSRFRKAFRQSAPKSANAVIDISPSEPIIPDSYQSVQR